MLSVIDSEILNDFFSSKPLDDESEIGYKKLEDWLAYRRFIKSETNLRITNQDNLNLDICKLLTDGRKDTKIDFDKRKINLHNDIIKFDCRPETFFCFNVSDKLRKQRIKSRNGYLVGFEDDYFDKWSAISLRNINSVIQVEESENNVFRSWNHFRSFVLPFTDLIICDSYILSDNSLLNSNLFPLWEVLDSINPVKYNMLIITYEGRNEKERLKIDDEFARIEEFKKGKKLKSDIGLVITSSKLDRVHDRNIIMNYLRIKSGDSFNLFDSTGSVITSTGIDLYTCSDHDEERATNSILKDLSKIVSKATEGNGIVKCRGNTKNRLLINN